MIELDPERADYYWERAGSFKLSGRVEQARADLQKAASMGHQEAKRELNR